MHSVSPLKQRGCKQSWKRTILKKWRRGVRYPIGAFLRRECRRTQKLFRKNRTQKSGVEDRAARSDASWQLDVAAQDCNALVALHDRRNIEVDDLYEDYMLRGLIQPLENCCAHTGARLTGDTLRARPTSSPTARCRYFCGSNHRCLASSGLQARR